MTKEQKGDLFLLLAAMIGGLGFISMKYLLEWEFTPFQIIVGRFFTATMVLYAFYLKELKKITKDEWKAGSILGFFLFLLFALMTIGLQYTTPSVNAFLSTLTAVIVPFILWGIFHKRPNGICFITAGMTLVGVTLLSVTGDIKGGFGALLSFGASVAFAFQMALIGKFLQRGDALHLALVEHLIVLILALFVAVLQRQPLPDMMLPAIGHFFLLGIFCTGVYFVLQSVGQKYTTASKAAILLTTEAVFASLAAAVFYGERLPLRGYIGCIIIFFAVVLTEIEPKQKITKNSS